MSETRWQPKPTEKKCRTCGSLGFMTSPLGKDRCSYCDGTEGGHPITVGDCADRIEELEAVIDHQHRRAETLAEGWRIADDARIELEAKLVEEIRVSNLRGNMIEFQLLPDLHDTQAKLAKAVEALSPLIDTSKLMQSASGYNRRLHQHEVTRAIWSQWSKQLKSACASLAELKGESHE